MKFALTLILLTFISTFGHATSPRELTLKHIGQSANHGLLDAQNNVITLESSGANVWDKRDDFDFAAIPLSGDIQITARILNVENCNAHTQAGIMIRSELTPEAVHAFMYFTPEMLCLHHRGSWRNSCRKNSISSEIKLPYWVRLIRQNDQIISQRSANGQEWHTVEIKTLAMQDTLYYGLAMASNDTTQVAKASFDNLSITPYSGSLTKEMENAIIQHHALYSNFVKDSFDILVGLPLGYDPDKPQTYPAAYHLDGGDNDDHYVIRNLMTDKLVPQVITIGIGYVSSNDQRFRDYQGGFDKFYLFMKNELIPFIESHYKTDPANRTLYGYSLGGLACMQTLYKYADDKDEMPFRGFVSGSPSLWYKLGNGRFNYEHEKRLYEACKILPVNLYMCMGSEEGPSMVPHFEKMTSILTSRHYQEFNFVSVLNQGKNHDSNKRICYRQGYLWLLNQPLPESLAPVSVSM